MRLPRFEISSIMGRFLTTLLLIPLVLGLHKFSENIKSFFSEVMPYVSEFIVDNCYYIAYVTMLTIIINGLSWHKNIGEAPHPGRDYILKLFVGTILYSYLFENSYLKDKFTFLFGDPTPAAWYELYIILIAYVLVLPIIISVEKIIGLQTKGSSSY